jgi:epoxyqueuosine reductase
MGDIGSVHFSAGSRGSKGVARTGLAGRGRSTRLRRVTGTLDRAAVKADAALAGFHEAGVARAVPLDPAPLDRVLAAGAEADMAWLRDQRAERLDPARLLPGARSVVAVALSHAVPEGAPPPPSDGEVARYARGRDYHTVVKRRLALLVDRLRARAPAARFFPSCDVAPVMEKRWAQAAGIGWIGKNGCLLTERHGSWVLLGTVLTDLEIEPDPPAVERCGDCDLCRPACPTQAIPEPGFVDARRCLSFWTIERRGTIPAEIAERLSGWAFGCDACQTACPWNARPAATSDVDLVPRPGQRSLDVAALLALGAEEYRLDGLVRNGCLLAGLSGDRAHAARLGQLAESPHEGVREAARWALARLVG